MLVVITTALVALGHFDSLRGPRIRLTFEATEPWCRKGETEGEGTALSVRIGVEKWEEVRLGLRWAFDQRGDGREAAPRHRPGSVVLEGCSALSRFDRMDVMPSKTGRSIVKLDDRDFHRFLNRPLNRSP